MFLLVHRGMRQSHARPLAWLLLIASALAVGAPPAHAQNDAPVIYYRTFPREDLNAVVRKLETSAAVVRQRNPGKIGSDGTLAPGTVLVVPTSEANRGRQMGAAAPVQAPPAALPSPPLPAADPPLPSPVAVSAPAPRPTNGPRGPGGAPPPTPAAAEPTLYDTRSSGITSGPRIGPPLWRIAVQFLGVTLLMVALVYGVVFLIKRFGWEASLARWGTRWGVAPAQPAGRFFAAPSGPKPTEEARRPRPFDRYLRQAAAESAPPDDASEKAFEQKTGPVALLGDTPKTDSSTRTMAFGNDPDDDQIPQTSLEDALQRRRKRAR